MMRKFLSVLMILFFAVGATMAQDKNEEQKDSTKKEEGFVFTPVINIEATPIKDQNRSGTCWAYSALSFLESEMLKTGKPTADLSEAFVVWQCYSEKATKYMRMHGATNFGPGGAFHDAIWCMENFGMVPDSVYNGLVIGEKRFVHGEMDVVLKKYIDAVMENKNKKLTPVWHDGFNALLNTYIGQIPANFTYQGKSYTPKTFASDYIGLKSDDYVEIGSYMHHPFYEKFILEIPDNWLWDEIYNVPVNEMMEIIDNALSNGYTIAWGADVSDRGFATKTKGIALIPDVDFTEMKDSEISKWEKLDEAEQQKKLYDFSKPCKEKVITQEMRQIDFDNYETTDDHGMHIVGTATDQKGNVYYKVKNSWGAYNKYDGYFYASKAFVALRTTDYMVNKNGIPKALRKKMGL